MFNNHSYTSDNEQKHKEIRKSMASCIIVLIALIFATMAWFSSGRIASIGGLNLGAAEKGDVQIGLNKTDWTSDSTFDIGVKEKTDSAELESELETATDVGIKEPAFNNIYGENGNGNVELVTIENSKIMAPGTYGYFTFYIRTESPSLKSCNIHLTKIFNKTNFDNNSIKTEIENLFSGHILCFSKRTKKSEYSGYLYSGMINDSSMNVKFDNYENGEAIKEVTIYWVWPYEFKDLTNTDVSKGDAFIKNEVSEDLTADEIKQMTGMYPQRSALDEEAKPASEDYPLEYNNVYETTRYKESVTDYKSGDNVTKDNMLTEWYDYADTLMASYIKNLKFNISVEGAK